MRVFIKCTQCDASLRCFVEDGIHNYNFDPSTITGDYICSTLNPRAPEFVPGAYLNGTRFQGSAERHRNGGYQNGGVQLARAGFHSDGGLPSSRALHTDQPVRHEQLGASLQEPAWASWNELGTFDLSAWHHSLAMTIAEGNTPGLPPTQPTPDPTAGRGAFGRQH
ncbi:uncharacterized protein LOC144134926 [Amblyomma americanum]